MARSESLTLVELIEEPDVPPVGTAFEPCKRLGHFCMATCYRGESSALCLACANGEDCEVVLLRKGPEALFSEPKANRNEHVIPPRYAKKPRVRSEKEGEAAMSGKRLTIEQVQQIRDKVARSDETATVIAADLKLPVTTVGNWVFKFRKELGIRKRPEPPPKASVAKPVVTATPPAVEQHVMNIPDPPPGMIGRWVEPPFEVPFPKTQLIATNLPEPRQDSAEVSFTLSATTLDAWWRDLPVKVKADLLAARMAMLLEKGEAV